MGINKRLIGAGGAAEEGAVGFNAVKYTGAGSTAVTVSTGFQPDLIWIKDLNNSSSHFVQDSSRGGSPNLSFISPNNTAADAIDNTAGVESIGSDGFDVRDYNVVPANGQGFSGIGGDYISYNWKVNGGTTSTNTDGTLNSTVQVNNDLGTSIVEFTNSSPSSSTRIGHGLDGTPDMILLKRLGVEDWYMYHTSMGLSEFMRLNLTNGQATAGDLFNTVNSTVFNPTFTGASGQEIIAYCFKNVDNYSHFGSYTGDATAGQAITTGFEPNWILIKSTVGSDNWRLYDTVRGFSNGFLEPNTSSSENTDNQPQLAVSSTGFSITSGGVTQGLNANGNLYIYWVMSIN